MSEKNGSSKGLIFVLLLAVLAGGYYFAAGTKDSSTPPESNLPASVETTETPAAPDTSVPQEETGAIPAAETPAEPELVTKTKTLPLPSASPAEVTVPADQTAVSADVAEMMSPRTIGSDDAPIKVIEYSSLTCGHCAAFHKTDLPQIEKEYVETGKVQFIFKEYPLNQPAVIASQVLRCMPKDQFVNFMGLLFEQQENWAYQPNFEEKLTQYAKLAGMSEDKVKACIANTELAQKIIGDMKAASDEYKISSTPTFIVNNGEKIIVGHQPYEFFRKSFDALLSGTPEQQ